MEFIRQVFGLRMLQNVGLCYLRRWIISRPEGAYNSVNILIL